MARGESPTDGGEPALAPDQAFTTLGNESRIRILQTLGTADTPLSFTELRDSVGIPQGAQFNYHLDQVVGHFVQKTDDGYALREPGRRIVQAILAGTVTDDPERHPTEIDYPCHHCGERVEVSYDSGKVRMSCRHCGGNFDADRHPPVREHPQKEAFGNLSNMEFPPAATQDRSPAEMFRAAATAIHLDLIAASAGVCPRCRGPVDQELASVCEDHDTTTGRCPACDHRNAVLYHWACTNCIYEVTTDALMGLLNEPVVQAFAGAHGHNVTDRGIEWGWTYGEEILATDPYEFRFTFTIDGDELTVRTTADLTVLEATD